MKRPLALLAAAAVALSGVAIAQGAVAPAAQARPLTVLAADPADGPLAIAQQPQAANVGNGAEASFTAAAIGGQDPVTVQWQRSTAANATAPPPNFINLGATNTVNESFAKPTLTVVAGANSNTSNRWYRAVFTDNEGTTVTSDAVKLSIIPAPTVTQHPNTIGQTIDEGGTATFTAAASSDIPMTVQWQANTTRLPNGEAAGDAWAPVDGATSETLTVSGTDSDAQHGTFYRAAFTNASGTTYSYAAELRFFDKLDTETPVTVSGESYGPVQPNTPFSVSAPNAIVEGEPIVIEGEGYLATDGTTGSVANFMVDASYSGDPNTLNTTREIINPVTGSVFADKRSHGIVQAGADGKWRIEIPWPDENNTNRDAAFFDSNWKPGSQHIVRILTGSLLNTPADYQRGISVRLTIAEEEPPAPEATVEVAETAELGGTLNLKGTGWFDTRGEGSKIGVKIDGGAYSRLDASVHNNRTIWEIVDADDEGNFDVDVQLPDGTTEGPNGSSPALPAGKYKLILLSGALKGNDGNGDRIDISRSIESAEFTVTEKEDPEPPAPINFIDVPKSHKFYTQIQWMAQNKITTGTKTSKGLAYEPKKATSREAMAAFLFRMYADDDYVAPKKSPFADVKTSHKFYTQIAWMYEEGISTGTKQKKGLPKYEPKAGTSREAMAAFLYRAEGVKGFKAPSKSPFVDVKKSDKFYTQIAWMAAEGISTGTKQPKGLPKYGPKASTSREAMSAFLYRIAN